MSDDVLLSIFLLLVGGWMTVHCSLGTARAYKIGVITGEHGGVYHRGESGFVMRLAVGLLAGSAGVLLAIAGCLGIWTEMSG